MCSKYFTLEKEKKNCEFYIFLLVKYLFSIKFTLKIFFEYNVALSLLDITSTGSLERNLMSVNVLLKPKQFPKNVFNQTLPSPAFVLILKDNPTHFPKIDYFPKIILKHRYLDRYRSDYWKFVARN